MPAAVRNSAGTKGSHTEKEAEKLTDPLPENARILTAQADAERKGPSGKAPVLKAHTPALYGPVFFFPGYSSYSSISLSPFCRGLRLSIH